MKKYAIIALTNWYDGDIKAEVVGEFIEQPSAEAEWTAFRSHAKANPDQFKKVYVLMDIHSGTVLKRFNNTLKADLDLEVEV